MFDGWWCKKNFWSIEKKQGIDTPKPWFFFNIFLKTQIRVSLTYRILANFDVDCEECAKVLGDALKVNSTLEELILSIYIKFLKEKQFFFKK